MPNLTREDILARKTGRGTVTLADGSTVAIRALTHAEVIRGQQEHAGDTNAMTCYFISTALTDPVLTFDDVMTWSEQADAGDLTTISEQVQQLSRLSEGAGKSGVPRPRKRQ
jgi:hypothetical protein